MKKINKVEDVDKNMTSKVEDPNALVYRSPKKNKKLKVEGLAFFEQEKRYFRIPTSYKGKVTDAVYWLAGHPSGGQIRFKSDANKISVRIKSSGEYIMPHMAKTGQQGVDLYYKGKGQRKYNFYTSTKFTVPATNIEAVVFESDTKDVRNFIINLPLYQNMDDIEIGINKDAKLYKPTSHKNKGRVVIYGTSVTQGGCAARPGMSFTNILSRKLDKEFINLGFSGSGLGEKELADIINLIDDVDLIILDYEANGGATGDMKNNLEPFIDTLRNKSKTVPILVLSKIPFSVDAFNKKGMDHRKFYYDFQKDMVAKKIKEGDKHIYFLDGNNLFGNVDVDEMTVDGYHPTDLGFYMMAKNLEKPIKNLLKNG